MIILYAFTTDERTFRFPPPGLTTKWFETVITSRPDFWAALVLSLEVAAMATGAALILGTLISAAMYRTKFFGRDAISLIVVLPLALPGIVTGIALRSAIGFAGISFSFWMIVIGHATFCIVVVYNNVIARLRCTARSQTEASMDLGGHFVPDLPAHHVTDDWDGNAGRRLVGLRVVVRRNHRNDVYGRAAADATDLDLQPAGSIAPEAGDECRRRVCDLAHVDPDHGGCTADA